MVLLSWSGAFLKKKYVNAKKFLEKDNICYFFKFLRSFPQVFVLSHATQAFSKKESEKKMFENERVIRILIKTRSCKKSDSATFMGLFSKKEGPKEYSSFQYKDLNIWYHQACASEKYGEKKYWQKSSTSFGTWWWV